jgi:hypothetical protein
MRDTIPSNSLRTTVDKKTTVAITSNLLAIMAIVVVMVVKINSPSDLAIMPMNLVIIIKTHK